MITKKQISYLFLSAVVGFSGILPDIADARSSGVSASSGARAASSVSSRAATSAAVRAASTAARASVRNSATRAAATRGASVRTQSAAINARYSQSKNAAAIPYAHAGKNGGYNNNNGGFGGGNGGGNNGGGKSFSYSYGARTTAVPYTNTYLPYWYYYTLATHNHQKQQVTEKTQVAVQQTLAQTGAITNVVSPTCVFLQASKQPWAKTLDQAELKTRINTVLQKDTYSPKAAPKNADQTNYAIWQMSLNCLQ
jgi:hypothetical protein